jgi:hypothetical protein
MALLTAPEGSDLEEFKRTRAFMMTRDEDDSSCTSSSSSSRSERCVGRLVRWQVVCVESGNMTRKASMSR